MKGDNEKIHTAQEELNHALLSKMQERENNKDKEPNSDAETTSYKRKSKQQNFSDNEDNCSTDGTVKLQKNKIIHSSDSSPKTRKYKPYEELAGEFRKIRPPTFNGEVEKGEEAEAWLSGINKYFQIYNYLDKLKARMEIYNLTGKADI